MSKKKKSVNYSNKSQIITLVIENVLITLTTVLFLSALLSFAALKLDFNKNILYIMTCGILFFAALINGLIFSKKIKIKGWLTGILSNSLLIISIILLHLFFKDKEFVGYFLLKIAAIIFAGFLGGILGINKKRKFK